MTLSIDTDDMLSFKQEGGEKKRKLESKNTRESCSTEHRKYSAKKKQEQDKPEERKKREEEKVKDMINQIQDINLDRSLSKPGGSSPLRKPTRA